jgi:hypothetical protein
MHLPELDIQLSAFRSDVCFSIHIDKNCSVAYINNDSIKIRVS